MRAAGLLAVAAFGGWVAACRGERTPMPVAADGGHAAFISTCAPAPPAPPSSARPDLREPRLTSLTRRPSSIVDVAPGRAPDPEHPAGTVYVAAVLDHEGRGQATLFEWDVASARAIDLEGRLLYRESDKQDNGRSTDVRIATTRDMIFAAVTLHHGEFTVIGSSPLRSVAGSLHGEYLPVAARNVSMETNGRWLAVAYENTRHHLANVILYDTSTMKPVAEVPFSQGRTTGVRYDILEFVGDRLFAADDRQVVELAVPSLKVLRTAALKINPRVDRVQLTSTRGHLVVLSGETLIELTPELEVVGTRAIRTNEAAVGPRGEILTPIGLEAPGSRGDFVPAARASASCTPAWAGPYPLLACAIDTDGVRVARLAPL